MLSAWKADQSKRKYRTQPMQCENQKPVLCWIFWPLIEDDLLPRWRQNRACLANEDGDIKKKMKTYFYIWCLCQLLNVDQRRCHTPCHVIQGLQLWSWNRTNTKVFSMIYHENNKQIHPPQKMSHSLALPEPSLDRDASVFWRLDFENHCWFVQFLTKEYWILVGLSKMLLSCVPSKD